MGLGLSSGREGWVPLPSFCARVLMMSPILGYKGLSRSHFQESGLTNQLSTLR